jgi:hypothetical protein
VKFLEHNLTVLPPYARRIEVESDGTNIRVIGHEPIGVDEWLRNAASRGREGLRLDPRAPHVEFSNLKTDEDLLAFLKRYGALGPMTSHGEKTTICVERKNHAWLRQRVVRSLAALLSVLQSPHRHDSGSVVKALDALAPDADQFFASDDFFGSMATIAGQTKATATREKTVTQLAHEVLCAVFSQFTAALVPIWPEGGNLLLAEVAPEPASKGIFPGLMLMLKRDYLEGHRDQRRVAICQRLDCGKAFVARRFGAKYCSPECSQLQGQREYYHRRGADLRKSRRKSQPTKGKS